VAGTAGQSSLPCKTRNCQDPGVPCQGQYGDPETYSYELSETLYENHATFLQLEYLHFLHVLAHPPDAGRNSISIGFSAR